ncbi:MAG: hypothetical protein AB1634_00450 [Thermodesulfobacteriota bacterium]
MPCPNDAGPPATGRKPGPDLIRQLGSRPLALAILAGMIAVLLPLGLVPAWGEALASALLVLGAALALNLAICTVQHWHHLPWGILALHLGVLAVLAGALLGRAGFVATVNIHEGRAASRVFRWDLGQETDLGVRVAVRRIGRSYYPVLLRVGLWKGEEKVGLFEVASGGSFRAQGLEFQVLDVDLEQKMVRLQVVRDGRSLGMVASDGTGGLSGEEPWRPQLVAFRTPVVKTLWVELELLAGERVVASGRAGVNEPLVWEGLRFFHTQTAVDEAGRPYAGIQIVRDPGLPVVYAGFALLALGGVSRLGRWWGGRR